MAPTPLLIEFSNLQDGETIWQRLLLVQGQVQGANRGAHSGSLVMYPSQQSGLRAQVFEVNDTHFKALVPLVPGANEVTFAFHGSKDPNASACLLSRRVKLEYQPTGNAPVHLAILVARDSPALKDGGRVPVGFAFADAANREDAAASQRDTLKSAFSKLAKKMNDAANGMGMPPPRDAGRAIVDAPPGPRRDALKSGGLDEVKRRFALQAYCWQAFHAEQMRRHNLGRRAFALDDMGASWPASGSGMLPPGAQGIQDLPKVHVLVSKHSLSEIRSPEIAQQNEKARDRSGLWTIAHEAINDPSTPEALRKSPVAILLLDATWDSSMRLLRGHAAVGGGSPGQTSLALMGSHWIWAAPSALEGVCAAFLDEDRVDERFVVNDLNECKSAWETLNVGTGAMLHELGHACDNPHWPSGIMARGYVQFNRAFNTREPFCARTGSKGVCPVTPQNDSGDNHLHRCQALRARWHPSFALPTDPKHPFYRMTEPQTAWQDWSEAEPIWEAGMDGVTAHCESGIACIELEVNDDFKAHVEYTGLPGGHAPPQSVTLNTSYISTLLGFDPTHPGAPRVKLVVVGCNLRKCDLNDYRGQGIAKLTNMPDFAYPVLKGLEEGQRSSDHEDFVVPFEHHRQPGAGPTLTGITLHAGAAFDGLILHYDNGAVSRVGPLGGEPSPRFPVQPGDDIARLILRSGAWIDAVEVQLRSDKSTGMRGNVSGGGRRVLECPPGQVIVGLYGSSQGWVRSLGLITRPQ